MAFKYLSAISLTCDQSSYTLVYIYIYHYTVIYMYMHTVTFVMAISVQLLASQTDSLLLKSTFVMMVLTTQLMWK